MNTQELKDKYGSALGDAMQHMLNNISPQGRFVFKHLIQAYAAAADKEAPLSLSLSAIRQEEGIKEEMIFPVVATGIGELFSSRVALMPTEHPESSPATWALLDHVVFEGDILNVRLASVTKMILASAHFVVIKPSGTSTEIKP
ncbi:hypothetical protein ICN84_01495 [Akkermansia glycaniphila]|uniref:hypothetical protein n=1 Tax=Akkermansia glycaniphila TaxID=1679444 RepID=UPI001C02D98D|nr:hypothetical protein [Akkermansia glycaniphila]MBT9448744.1 hypothetical protein [Akkermansia glycaniphila]